MATIYDDWEWRSRDGKSRRVREMDRAYIRNALQWCMRQNQMEYWEDFHGKKYTELRSKDKHPYRDWINAFVIKLLDPELPE